VRGSLGHRPIGLLCGLICVRNNCPVLRPRKTNPRETPPGEAGRTCGLCLTEVHARPSSLICNPWFEKNGVDAVVVPMGIKAEDYPDFFRSVL
jgi:hypothetical protein